MTIERAEQLKKEWTDQYVQVVGGVAELRRFSKLTGIVKSVNMNCRALVEWDSPEDIGWYDIDPTYLQKVDKPKPEEKKAAAAPKEKAAPAAEKTAKPAASAGLSPLEQARQQGAAGAAKPAGDAKALSPLEQARQQGAAGAAKHAEEKKALSPLEQARQQGSGGTAKTEEASAPAEEKPVEQKAAPPAETSGLSPLEQARQQGPLKK